MNMYDDVLGHLREARALLYDEQKEGMGSRELSLVITKIDEALLWRQENLSIRRPTVNEGNDNFTCAESNKGNEKCSSQCLWCHTESNWMTNTK